jgi:hypothetical protein
MGFLTADKVVGGEPIIARCDPTTLFDLVEEPLNQVAGATA